MLKGKAKNMKNKIKLTAASLFIGAILFTFLFIPLGGSTGFSVVLEGNAGAIIGFLAITSGFVGALILTIKAYKK